MIAIDWSEIRIGGVLQAAEAFAKEALRGWPESCPTGRDGRRLHVGFFGIWPIRLTALDAHWLTVRHDVGRFGGRPPHLHDFTDIPSGRDE